MTTSPSSRNRGLQPQIRYAPTTSQTKRLSDPAHVSHGKPSARAACVTSSADCTSHPMRTPQVASLPIEPGCRASPTYANAASPYARNAGQKRSSATLLLPREARQIRELLLEPRDLERDDQQVEEQRPEQHEVRAGHVLLGVRHASSSRSSRRLASARLPASSTRYRVPASASIPPRQTRNDTSI